MKERILNGWNFVRWFWLIMGIAIAVASVIQTTYVMLVPALYFILGAVLNVGCFAASCATDLRAQKKVSATDTQFDNEYSNKP